MLSQISWTDFVSSVTAITILYYVVTIVHYYRYEIVYRFSAKDKTE